MHEALGAMALVGIGLIEQVDEATRVNEALSAHSSGPV